MNGSFPEFPLMNRFSVYNALYNYTRKKLIPFLKVLFISPQINKFFAKL